MSIGIRACIVLAAVLALTPHYAAHATPWAVVANSAEATISTIDLGTTPPTLHGPFLAGELGTDDGGLFDVAVVPNSPYILVTNFGDELLFRVDVSDPTAPVAAGSIEIGFSAEDVAVAPNGKFALVTDGGYKHEVAVIDLDTFALTTISTLKAGAAQAVAIAPDNQTAVFVDYFARLMVFGLVDPATGIVSDSSLPTDGMPLNVAISPDGQTAIVANFGNTAPPSPTLEAPAPMNVYRITGPGTVVEGTTPIVEGLPGCQQSVAFSPDGSRAYVETCTWAPSGTPVPEDATTQLSWLSVTGPGQVSLGAAAAANLLSKTHYAWFGVDTLAVSGDGKTALATNTSGSDAVSSVSAVDLSTWSVSAIGPVSTAPAGIAMLATPTPTLTPTLTPTPTQTPTPILMGVASSKSPSVGGVVYLLSYLPAP
ncbi:MAG TPA: hypothetical protein PK696_00195 [bacterium]|nr:hypothetical protein [bacterium]